MKKSLQFFVMIAIFINVLMLASDRTFANEKGNLSIPNQNQSAPDTSSFASPGFTIHLWELDPIDRGVKTQPDGNNKPTSQTPMWLFTRLMESISNLLLLIIPILAGVSLIIAGYFYIFSFSDAELQSKAKTIIKYNLFAMGVAFLSFVIISIIAGFF